MNNSTVELTKLLQEALCNTTHNFKVVDQKELYKQAKDNGISGSIFEVLQQHVDVVDPSFKKDFYLYVSHDQKQLSMIDLVTTLFKDNKIEYKLLKGSIMKTIYPKSYFRAMGDVDILVRIEDLEKAHSLLNEKGFKLDQGGPVHNHYTYGDLELEVHQRLRPIDKYPEYSVLDHIWESESYLEMELLFLLFHLKKHMITGGIGLRSVIDISLYVKHYLDELDFDTLTTLLEQTKSTTFFHQLIIFNDQYLGLDLKKSLHIEEEFNHDLFETFTKYIITSGIHGLGMSFNNYIGKLANDQNHGLSKKGSFIKQIFLPYSSMKYMYPTLLRIKLLLPLAWILRIFKVVFKNTKRFLIRLKLYKVDQETIDEASSLFHQMGI